MGLAILLAFYTTFMWLQGLRDFGFRDEGFDGDFAGVQAVLTKVGGGFYMGHYD